MKKKIIKLTEQDLMNIVKRVISEQKTKGKLFFAIDNDITNFSGFIGSDGYLYPYTEELLTWKIGPIAKVPYTGSVRIRIDKRKDNEVILVGRNSNNFSKLELAPNYTVKKVNYNSIPKAK
jgi:hypothetical protein